MGRMFYFVTVIGVFLQAVHGQDYDIEILKQCPCANNIIENYLESVAKDALDIGNGQKLRLRLWQEKNDDCSVNIVDKSPNPGQIEINMAYRGSVSIEEQGEGEDQQQGNMDVGQQPGSVDVGQQPGSVNVGQQPGRVDVGQQTGSVDIGEQTGSVDIGQQKQDGDTEPQKGDDNGQQQETQDGAFLKAEDIEEMLSNIDIDELKERLAQLLQAYDASQDQDEVDNAQEQAGVDAAQEQVGADTAQKQSQSSSGSYSGADKKEYSTAFSFSVDVNTGTLSDSIASVPASSRRKRDAMPFDTVVIRIKVNLNTNLDSDVATRNNQIKSLLGKNLGDYWLAMAYCILGVKE